MRTRVREVRSVMVLLGACNVLILSTGSFLVLQTSRLCRPRFLPPFIAPSLSALLRLFLMLQTARAQRAAASLILHSHDDNNNNNASQPDSLLRLQRRVSYKTWLRWSRCTLLVMLLQFLCAGYLLFKSPDYFSKPSDSDSDDACVLGRVEMEL